MLSVNHLIGFGSANAGLPLITINVTTNQTNYNLRTAAGSPAYACEVVCNIQSGAHIYATSTGTAAFDTGTGWIAGSKLKLVVQNGYISGKGGDGANRNGLGSGIAGTNGGNAINMQYAMEIDVQTGYIGGGGGGGGGAWWRDNVPSEESYGFAAGGGGAGGGAGGDSFYTDFFTGTYSGVPGAGGAVNAVGSDATYDNGYGLGGGGGGRVFTGSGGGEGLGGGAGGGGGEGFNSAYETGGSGGAGSSAGSNGSNVADGYGLASGGGGGGWGNNGGSSERFEGYGITSGTLSPGTGGKAVNKNGNTLTWTGGSQPATVYGAVS